MTLPASRYVNGIVLLFSLATWVAATEPAVAAALPGNTLSPGIHWLAAGDSYSSGQGLSDETNPCARSNHAWPEVAGDFFHVQPTFLACSGATIMGPATANSWTNQYETATSNGEAPYDLITFTFGGNDLRFASKLLDCAGINAQLLAGVVVGGLVAGETGVGAGLLHQVADHQCSFTPGQLDADIQMVSNLILGLLTDIEGNPTLLAPDGQVVVADYPLIFADPTHWDWYWKTMGYCNGIAASDVKMWRKGIAVLNADIVTDARKVNRQGHGPRIHVVDVNATKGGSFADHGLCSTGGEWINDFQHLVPDPFDAFHPNAIGQAYYARQVEMRLKTLRFAPGKRGATNPGPANPVPPIGEPAPTPSTSTTTTTSTTVTIPPIATLSPCGLAEVGQACTAGSPPPPAASGPRPTTSRIAFQEGISSGLDALFVMNSDGSDQAQLTPSSIDVDVPAISPDGSRIAFNAGGGSIDVVDSDGGTLTVLPTGIPGYWPAWSPDGTKIAFLGSSAAGAGSDVYVIDADGTGLTRLTTDGREVHAPTWSPDGTQIAYVDGVDIDVMGADGSNQRVLIKGTPYAFTPRWSPDGTTIAYWSSCTNPNDGTCIFLARIDGSATRQLVGGAEETWSPDGTKLAYVGGNGIFTVDADGSDATQIATGGREPSWLGE